MVKDIKHCLTGKWSFFSINDPKRPISTMVLPNKNNFLKNIASGGLYNFNSSAIFGSLKKWDARA